MDTRDALGRAREAGLDLVEVSPNSRPPVCRIMDYGKWKYAQKKKDRKAKAHRHETELKEVRIKTPKISKHDLQIKVNHARDFLARGDRVQFTLRFRGREMAHVDLGQGILVSIKEGLADIAKVDRDFRMENRRLSLVFTPIAGLKASTPRVAARPQLGPKAGDVNLLEEAEKLAQPGKIEEVVESDLAEAMDVAADDADTDDGDEVVEAGAAVEVVQAVAAEEVVQAPEADKSEPAGENAEPKTT